jgi:hypothetical protein
MLRGVIDERNTLGQMPASGVRMQKHRRFGFFFRFFRFFPV